MFPCVSINPYSQPANNPQMAVDNRLPFTVLLPDSWREPIEIHDQMTALCLAIVEKDSVRYLDDSWDRPGLYVLLDTPGPSGTFGAYVGKAPSGVRSRLGSHERGKVWNRALLIRRDTGIGLSSAQVGWLEGDLYDLLSASQLAVLSNAQKPGDDTLPSYELRILESFRDPINRVLRLLGYNTSTAGEATQSLPGTKTKRRTPVFHGIKLADLAAAGLVAVGDKLTSTQTLFPAVASVGPDGTVIYEGNQYPTPSAAGVAARGKETNGWDFWAVQNDSGSHRLSAIRKRYQDTLPTNTVTRDSDDSVATAG